ncbi:hypothetical protein MAR_031819, partial [Mya arenaria]
MLGSGIAGQPPSEKLLLQGHDDMYFRFTTNKEISATAATTTQAALTPIATPTVDDDDALIGHAKKNKVDEILQRNMTIVEAYQVIPEFYCSKWYLTKTHLYYDAISANSMCKQVKTHVFEEFCQTFHLCLI